ncbi:GGDEF domain-containing protein [Amphiplicatus metriothermophilus]|uniref:diguanylate cyclase n=1 Tax=Amphiplicatus metriothermophilus TaxID=1519374 RepID=A0A239PZF8_9PROT|nr:GGDEF domain-containing protein [Amphiplicatus metriothermophilus]MBB5520150.1 diguanylate cyclase (GGDEF)-like protein [Amphiplicatus metriothermophilus]SNT75739.1 diguanylate cyclase (GGDEF) domain-containing protein [Amphiplicatus metriothermophilus]
MKISGPTRTVSGKTVTRGASPVGASGAAQSGSGPSPIVDKISIAGIPHEELTPRVREALTTLMNEIQALKRDLENAKARIEELEQLADSDPLLGVLNRRGFLRELGRALAMAERHGAPSALVFADLNDLKQINDTMGHAAGDAALAHAARIIAANIRQTDALGRIGGDEFAVVLAQTDEAGARVKADKLAARVSEEPVGWHGAPFRIEMSFGVVALDPRLEPEQALQLADRAMYQAKKAR